MSKAIRTILTVIVTLALCSVLTMAQATGNDKKTTTKTTKTANQDHHSRLSKAAFWHHKDGDQNGKSAKAKKTPSKKAPAKTSQKSAKTAQLKPAKMTTGKKDQKHASKTTKPSSKKATAKATAKTKPQPKAKA
jgi:hypothetical protein